MRKNNFIIATVLGTTLLSTKALGSEIFLGPGNLVINGDNYTSEEANMEITNLDKFELDSLNQYQLSEDDKKAWMQYGNELITSNSEFKTLFQELEEVDKNANLSKNEQNEKLHFINQQIYTNNAYNQVRIQPANQEILKLRLKKIEHARELARRNKPFINVINEEVKLLKRDLAGYLVTDFQNKKVSDIPEVQQSDSDITEGLVNASLITRGIIDARINNFSGISSGEIPTMAYGIWTKGVLSQGVQKSSGNSSGYKFNQTGGAIGIDMGDESVFGIAYSYLKGDIKNKNNSTNKSSIETHAVSLYSKVTFTDTIFATGQAQFGVTKIKKKRATGDIANNIATSSPSGDTTLGKIEVGYDFSYEPAIHIIPAVGISYTSVHVKDYTEKGEGLNRTVGHRITSRTSGVANITAKYVLETGYAKIIPEVRAGIDYAFSTKNSGTEVKILDVIDEITTPSKNLNKSFYIVGAGIKTIQSDHYEISAGYDMGFSKKFQSHTGTLKLRVNL